ncbi:hypothetical protein ACFLTA_05750 [Bacteroidota bacterium]
METTNSNNAFISNTRAGDNYSKGWNVSFTLFVELIVVTLAYAVIQIPTNMIQIKGDGFELWMIPLAMLGMAYGVFIAGPIGMSADWVFLKAVRREKIEIKDMFSVFERNYWNAVLASLIKTIIIVFGILMLIVPGIIFACRLAFVNYLIVDEKMEALEALKTSWAMTKGHGWTIFGMFWLAIPIVIAGLICFFFGVFISAMWITASFAVLYHAVYVKKGIPPTNGTVAQVPVETDSPVAD